VDLPGFGEAVPEGGPQAPWEDVLGTMDALDIDRAALIGNSFGGAVALRVAALAPGRVWALVLISSPALSLEPSERLEAAWEAESAALERGDIDAAVNAVVDAWTLPDAPADLRARVADMQRRAFELQSASEPEEAPDPLEIDPQAISRITAPALIVAGEHDMADFKDGAAALAEVLGGAPPVVIKGAGHLAPLEAASTLRELLVGFLASL